MTIIQELIKESRKNAVLHFTAKILHGNDEYRKWLIAAAHEFNETGDIATKYSSTNMGLKSDP